MGACVPPGMLRPHLMPCVGKTPTHRGFGFCTVVTEQGRDLLLSQEGLMGHHASVPPTLDLRGTYAHPAFHSLCGGRAAFWPGELAGCCGHTFSALFPFPTRPQVCIYFQVTLSKKDIFRNMAANDSHFLASRLSSVDTVFRDIRAQWCLGASELTLDPLGSSLDEAMIRSGTLPKTGTQRLIFFSSRYVLFLLRCFMTD